MNRNDYEETDSRLDASAPHAYEAPKTDYSDVAAQRNYILTGLQSMSDACEDGQHEQCHKALHDLCKCECHKAPAVAEPEPVIEQTQEAEDSASTITAMTYNERVDNVYAWIKANRSPQMVAFLLDAMKQAVQDAGYMADFASQKPNAASHFLADFFSKNVTDDSLLHFIELWLESYTKNESNAFVSPVPDSHKEDERTLFAFFGTTPEIENDEEKRVAHIEATWGGARAGAGRKPTPDAFDERSYQAGYKAGMRAKDNFPTPNEETLLDEAGEPYAVLHWGYCPTCGQKNAWKSYTTADQVDSVVEACQCVNAGVYPRTIRTGRVPR